MPETTADTQQLQTPTPGTGCFWCTEAIFQLPEPLVNATGGYSGGVNANPTYEQECAKNTRQAESVNIIFDKSKNSFDELINNYHKIIAMKIYMPVLVSLFFSLPSFAQKFSASIDLQMSLPEGEYKKANRDAGIGGRGNFFFRPGKNIPVKIGIESGFQVKGSTSQYFSGFINGFYDDFKVSASNNIFSLMFLARLQPEKHGKIKPLIDAIAGWNVFFSTVTIERLTYFSDYNSSYSNSSKAKWAFTYGTAAGLDIPLNKRDDVGLEIKCAYLIGSSATYLTDPRIDNSGEVFFSEKTSTTDMLIPQVGVRISIQ
ncbi:MAG: peptide-methionine (S)-S-oxide reductase [Ginsengibacter sp.]